MYRQILQWYQKVTSWLIKCRVCRFFYNLFHPEFTVETNGKYAVITLISGFRRSKIFLPVRKSKIEKVFLCKDGKIIDITHPYDIDYFLTLEDLQGDYFIVKKNNTLSKVKDLKNV